MEDSIEIIKRKGYVSLASMREFDRVMEYCRDNNITYAINSRSRTTTIMTEKVQAICVNLKHRIARIYNCSDIAEELEKKRFQRDKITFTLVDYIYPMYGDSIKRLLIERYMKKGYRFDTSYFWIFEDRQFYHDYFAKKC